LRGIEKLMIMNLGQHKHIAEFWDKDGDYIKCVLCPHHCLLKNGQVGICRTRKNIDGELISLVFGYPCALHVDPIEKKPLYHFHPGSKIFSLATTGCNLRCLNCQNSTISQHDFDAGKDYYSPDEIVSMAISSGCNSIAYTYTDPVVFYEYACDIAKVAIQYSIKNVIVSAAYLNKEPLKKLLGVVDAANIDLKCFDAAVYKRLCGADLNKVLDNLLMIRESGVWLEITNLLIPGYTDDLKMISAMCIWLVKNGFQNNPIHFSRFFPSYKLAHLEPTVIKKMNDVYVIAIESGLKFVYMGNVPASNKENTYCSKCNSLLIERFGYHIDVKGIQGGVCVYCKTKVSGVFS